MSTDFEHQKISKSQRPLKQLNNNNNDNNNKNPELMVLYNVKKKPDALSGYVRKGKK